MGKKLVDPYSGKEFKKIKLPSFSQFESKSKRRGEPLNRFYEWAVPEYVNTFLPSLNNLFGDSTLTYAEMLSYLKEADVSVSNFWVHEKDEEKLKDLQLMWYRKAEKRTIKSGKASMSALFFGYGPAFFSSAHNDMPYWCEEGYLYIYI